MRHVEVTADVAATPEEVLEALTPRSLIEFENTFEVTGVTETDDGWLVTGEANAGDERIEMTVSVDRLPNGYAYELVEGGFFDELSTSVHVHEPEPGEIEGDGDGNVDGVDTVDDDTDRARIVWESEFTFGGLLAPVKDRLSDSNRQLELKRAMFRLGRDIDAIELPADGSVPDGMDEVDDIDDADESDEVDAIDEAGETADADDGTRD